jgi:hypothetical protein
VLLVTKVARPLILLLVCLVALLEVQVVLLVAKQRIR